MVHEYQHYGGTCCLRLQDWVERRVKQTVRNVEEMTEYNYESNQQDALYRVIYYSKSALYVSGDVFARHQEHLTVFTVSGSAGSYLGERYQIL
jgi:hypothetical protein